MRPAHGRRMGLTGRGPPARWLAPGCTCWPWRAVAGLEAAAPGPGGQLHGVDLYGFTPRIPELISACDLVVTLPGALTCGEARAVERQLMLVNAMPSHGRENVQHELELGGAEVASPRPLEISAASVLAALEQPRPGPAGRPRVDRLRRGHGGRRAWREPRPEAPAAAGPRRDRRSSARTVRPGGRLSVMRTLPAPAVVRGVRRRGGFPLSGQARDPVNPAGWPRASPPSSARAARSWTRPRRGSAPATCSRWRTDSTVLAVLHTSSPSFAGDVQVAQALKPGEPGAEGRLRRRQGGGGAGSVAAGVGRDRFRRPPKGGFDSAIAEISEGRPLDDVRGVTYRDPAAIITRTGRSWKTWTGCRTSPTCTGAT